MNVLHGCVSLSDLDIPSCLSVCIYIYKSSTVTVTVTVHDIYIILVAKVR